MKATKAKASKPAGAKCDKIGEVAGVKERLDKRRGDDDLLKVSKNCCLWLMVRLFIEYSISAPGQRMRSRKTFASFPAFISPTT